MTNYILTEKLEKKSRFGPTRGLGRLWYWQELYTDTAKPTGAVGRLTAITEIEALDRLREAFPQIGRIEWIHKSVYEQITKKKKGVRNAK